MKNKKLTISAIFILIILLGVASASYYAAYTTLHKAKQPLIKSPVDYGLTFEDIEFTNEDGMLLKGWWIDGEKSDNDKVIIVAHGYSANRAGWLGTDKENKEHYLDWLAVAPHLVKQGYNMLYFDMRASGESEGKVITLGKYEADDMLASIKWQLKEKKKRSIGLLGYSMGGNVVLRAGLSLNKMMDSGEIKKISIISVGPYKYNTMMRKSIAYWTNLPTFFTPLINYSAKHILGFNPSEEIDPSKYVGSMTGIPLYFIQSELDEIGDVDDVRDIYSAAKEPKQITIIPNAKRFVHYNWPAKNPKSIIDFYNKYL